MKYVNNFKLENKLVNARSYKKDPKMQETKTLKREANISQIQNSGDSEILV